MKLNFHSIITFSPSQILYTILLGAQINGIDNSNKRHDNTIYVTAIFFIHIPRFKIFSIFVCSAFLSIQNEFLLHFSIKQTVM